MGYKETRDSLKDFSEKILAPIIVLLNKLGFTPNVVTWVGLVLTIIGAVVAGGGHFISAAFIILFASIFDMLDGMLARKTNKKTKFGGFLDSTTDRLSEGAIYLAIMIYYAKLTPPDLMGIALCYIVMFSSFLVSYIRARAGGLRIDCSEGIFTRPERMVVLILLMFFQERGVMAALWIISVLSVITIVQRFMLVYKQAKYI